MIKNYFKTALRNMKRQKVYTFINITGLTVCISCCILIFIYVKFEFSFDKFHENSENIYRVVQRQKGNFIQGTDWFNSVPAVLAPTVKKDIPEVIHITRIKQNDRLVRYKNKQFNESRFFYVESSFLKMFTFPTVMGNAETALREPYTVMITREMAKKYFGDEIPIGKIVNVNDEHDYRVTGVLENVPNNSHFRFDFLASFQTCLVSWGESQLNRWNNSSVTTYLLLSESMNPDEIEAKLSSYNTKSFGGHQASFHIQPLTRIHLYSDVAFEVEANSDIRYIYLFSTIALFIMLIACFNYTNLSVAQSASRAKEVGMRKVIGANRQSLIKQFFGESLVFSFFALVLSVFLVRFFLPIFNSMTARYLKFDIFKNGQIIIAMVGITIVVGLISGIYPALFLSSFNPSKILKGSFIMKSKRSILFRDSLVTFQFVVSIAIITCTIIINNQLHFIKNKKLGFNKEHVMVLRVKEENLKKGYPSFKRALNRHSQVSNITASYHLPIDINNSALANWEGQIVGEDLKIMVTGIDYNFIDFYEMEIIQGRNFSRDFSTDLQDAYILNETAAKAIGFDNPIGKRFGVWKIDGRVIGVVKDFHFAPLHFGIRPLVIKLAPDECRYISVKINSDNIPNALDIVKAEWREFFPDSPFEYSFINERIDKIYRSEQKLGQSFNYFTIVALSISFLGLVGLVSYTVERKTKEIGIRKVLGASISNIVLLLSREFIVLVLLANIVAWPIAYYAMNKWLQSFAFRVNIGLWIFLVSAALALVIALLTVIYQAVKASLADPVDSLRYE